MLNNVLPRDLSTQKLDVLLSGGGGGWQGQARGFLLAEEKTAERMNLTTCPRDGDVMRSAEPVVCKYSGQCHVCRQPTAKSL